MKILVAECCWTLVVPHREPTFTNFCLCGAAACWWAADLKSLVVHGQYGPMMVSILGIHNGILEEPFVTSKIHDDNSITEFGCIQKDKLARIIAETPDSYLFKRLESLVVRFRPGFTNDVRWAQFSEFAERRDAELRRKAGTSPQPAGGQPAAG